VAISCPAAAPVSGGTFTSEITIDVGSQPLGAYTLIMIFDPTVVAMNGLTGGMTDEFSGTPIANSADFPTGRVRLSAFNSSSLDVPTGVVSVATMTFDVTGAPGTSTDLGIEIQTVADTNGAPIPAGGVGCTVMVIAPGSHTLRGRIRYYTAGRPVPGAIVTVRRGMENLSEGSDAMGDYSFFGLTSADTIVEPRKNGDLRNAISVLDSTWCLQKALNLRSFTQRQELAGDVTGNGRVSVLDATLILRFRLGLITQFPITQACGIDWLFDPEPAVASNQSVVQPATSGGACAHGQIRLEPLVDSAQDQDFSAVLLGDVTGNWQASASGAGGSFSSQTPLAHEGIRLGNPVAGRRVGTLSVFINAPQPMHAFEIQLGYDPTRFRIRNVRTRRAARGALITWSDSGDGVLRIAAAAPRPIDATGPTLAVRFQALRAIRGRAAMWVEQLKRY